MKFYTTAAEAQAELERLAQDCPIGFKLKAKAYRAMADKCAEEALEQDSWAKEGLARKYELLADLAEHQGMHKFMVLAELDSDTLIDVAPILVPNGYSGKLEERWSVQHLRDDRWHVPYASKRPHTLSRYGYREVWLVLPASVGTQSTEKTKHFSSNSLHLYKIKDETLVSLGLPPELVERYRHRFGTFFTDREQENVFRRYLDEDEQLLALGALTPRLPEAQQRSSAPALA